MNIFLRKYWTKITTPNHRAFHSGLPRAR